MRIKVRVPQFQSLSSFCLGFQKCSLMVKFHFLTQVLSWNYIFFIFTQGVDWLSILLELCSPKIHVHLEPANGTFFVNRVFGRCNQFKKRVDPNTILVSVLEEGHLDTDMQGECRVIMEVEILKGCVYKPVNTKDWQKPSETQKRQENILAYSL